jgi:hypothetical protein
MAYGFPKLIGMPVPNIKRLLIAVALTAVVLILTHLPPDVIPPVLQMKGLDKVQHTLAYAFITLLFLLSVKAAVSPAQILFLLLFVSAIGIVDEVTQPLVNRTASFGDWLADVGGTVTVLVSSIYLKNSKRKTPTNKNACQPNSDR